PTAGAILVATLCAAAFVQSHPSSVAGVPLEVKSLVDYAPCFAAGLLMSRRDFPRAVAFAVVGAGLVVLAAVSMRLETAYLQHHMGYGLVYAGVVSLAMGPFGARRVLSNWRLVWLGERSYSLFLIHGVVMLPVFHGISMLVPQGATYLLLTRIVGLPACLLAAMVLFTCVERRYARGLVTADTFWPKKL
ncbi:MAG TPA: hypothetical protein VKU41_22155, partial [Polyangiaceae bacterium]|nr:hypothetical protein [Polyangiaceae bacterium]